MDDLAVISGTTRVFAILADPIAQVKSPQAVNRLAANAAKTAFWCRFRSRRRTLGG